MAVLNQSLFQDTNSLIKFYQTMASFRERFDGAIRRSVNVTYKYRPLKLYFEVLANINAAKFKGAYQKIRGLVKHDEEEIIKKTLLGITPKDLHDLNLHAKKAKEENINTTTYTKEEIEKINKIEETSKSLKEKAGAHKERLDKLNEAEGFAIAKKTAEAEDTAKTEEKVPQPASEEPVRNALARNASHTDASGSQSDAGGEKAAFLTPLSRSEKGLAKSKAPAEVSENISEGPGGEPIRHINQESPIESQRSESSKQSLPKTPSKRRISQTREFFSSPTTFIRNIFRTGGAVETIGAEAGARIATGRVAVAGAEKLIAKVGVGTAAKAGVGLLAKLGVSVATGAATAGVGFVVSAAIFLATTFGGQIKKLGKLFVQIAIGLACFILFMFFGDRLWTADALLPPYKVAESAPIETITPPVPVVTPPLSPCDNNASADALKQDIISRFGITMNGFDKSQLQWACNKLNNFSQTNFISLTRGTIITAVEGHDSEQTGCRTLNLGNKYGSEEVFDVILTHELSHIIGLCNPGESAHLIDHANAWDSEGGVTSYSRTGCVPGTVPKTEDYAEMLTYYLNPTSNTISANCAEQQANPYLNGGYPQHKRVAEMILGRYP